MRLLYLAFFAWVAFALPGRGAAVAGEVRISHEGRTLVGSFEAAASPGSAQRLVLMVHGTMGHRDMDVMRRFRKLLAERGQATLAISLSLGVERREGMFDCGLPSRHRAEDALAEIGAWLDWAAAQGARRVALLGFSRGGQQAAWFAAEQGHPALARLVLLAPIFATDAARRYEARFGRLLAPLLAEARARVAAGRGTELLREVGFLNCERTDASAQSFLSYYAPAPSADPDATLARVAVPTLVVVAGGDEVVPGLERRLAHLADGRRLRLVTIAGSDHFFHDLYGEDAADAIAAFLGVD